MPGDEAILRNRAQVAGNDSLRKFRNISKKCLSGKRVFDESTQSIQQNTPTYRQDALAFFQRLACDFGVFGQASLAVVYPDAPFRPCPPLLRADKCLILAQPALHFPPVARTQAVECLPLNGRRAAPLFQIGVEGVGPPKSARKKRK